MFIVPARAGSKRLPGKNLLEIEGKSLVSRAVSQGLRAVGQGVITTDLPGVKYLEQVHKNLLFVDRPEYLATDNMAMNLVIEHSVGTWNIHNRRRADFFVLLQPTSPFRSDEDIETCIDMFLSGKKPSVVSVGPSGAPNGAVYVCDAKKFLQEHINIPFLTTSRAAAYRMPVHRSLDIDTQKDYEEALQWSLQASQ